MAEVTVYTTTFCPYCVSAKRLLERKGVAYREINVGHDMQLRVEVEQRSKRRTVPQIWIDEFHVGGCDDLYALERTGKLDALLENGREAQT